VKLEAFYCVCGGEYLTCSEAEETQVKINGLIWLAEIVEKLAWKHQVQQEEVREVFRCQSRYRFVEKGHRRGENVYVAQGKTEAGRYLNVFFVYKADRRALILSARDMTPTEKRTYGKK
jgi:uncharacterized DUF497 family protein